jgi:PAS domain S-box-containing protein
MFTVIASDALLARIVLAIADSDSLETGLQAALHAVCDATGWLVGEAWLPVGGRLNHAGVHTHGSPRLDAFANQGGGFTFAPGEGLPGAAWQRREPVFIRQLTDCADFTRAPLAAAAGIKTAAAFPVLAGDDVVAVFTFYITGADDEPLVETTGAVLRQLGPLVRRKQADEARHSTAAALAGIVAIALDAIISIDHARHITLFNWGAERVFGYSADEVIGRPLDILLPADLRERHATHIAHFAASSSTARRMGERSPIVGQRKNGEIFPAEASISRFRAGGQWMYTVILRDVTDRQRTEDGLRFLAETGAPLADLLHDPTGLQRIAERAVPTLGDLCIIDLADAEQITTAAVAATDPTLAIAARDARDRDTIAWDGPSSVADAIRRRETVLIGESEGSQSTMLVVPLVVRDRVLGAITFAMIASGRRHDASYRALAEELAVRLALAVDGAALYQRTRHAVGARDEVLAVVSHDLRNPLSAIEMCVSALRETPAPSPDASAELLGSIHESANWMSHIIQDLLDVASIDAGRLSIDRQSQSLGPILARAQAMFQAVAEERGIALLFDPMPPGTPDASVDADRILQVLANLLDNACKFTPAGGTVRVTVHDVPGTTRIAVTDTGPGIAREDVIKVFDRFWHADRQARMRSTGLGLAIARGIVDAHGGRIWVDSTLGRGSTFYVALPTPAEVQRQP